MTRRTVLVLGATSAIARGVAEAFARRGYALYLAGRSADELRRVGADLRIRHGVEVRCGFFDAAAPASHQAFIDRVLGETGGELHGVVIAFGEMGEHARAVVDFAEAREIIDVNFVGAVSVLTAVAPHLERQRRGFIAALTSVAGDRGRGSNYVYGSAKGALTLFLQGLRNRLHASGVRVHTFKLGFVDTRMTFGRPGVMLSASPSAVGEGVVARIERGVDVAYLPGFWRVVMAGIRGIPEGVFKRMRL